jgi:antitoxin component of MazEF toxin-antitoxin module
MYAIKLIEVGDALAVILPDAMLSHMNVVVGDSLDVTELAAGTYRLTPSTCTQSLDNTPADQNKK